MIFAGGNRTDLTPAKHVITNSRIHNFARILQKYTPGVCLTGVGHTVSHTSISHGAHFGMLLTGEGDGKVEGTGAGEDEEEQWG